MNCKNCREQLDCSIIKVEEGRRCVYFVNSEHAIYYKVRVDNCVVIGETAADYVVSRVGDGDVIVELKGTDVEHALEQIIATASYIYKCERVRGPLAGVVVCRQYPRFDSKVRRLTTEFARKFRGPVRVFARTERVLFHKMLAFEK